MKTIIVVTEKNRVQVTNCPLNFTVTEEQYDLGSPVGNGSTLEKALEDFKTSAELKYDEEIAIFELV